MHGCTAPLFALVFLCMSAITESEADSAATPAESVLEEWKIVSDGFDARLAAARERYSEKLDAIYTRYRESGDLDAVLVVRGERARLQEQGLPSTADRVGHPPELSALQDLVLKQHARWRTDRASALAGFVEKAKRLSSQQEELTRNDKIDEALEVRREIAALKSHPEFGPLLAIAPEENSHEGPAAARPAAVAESATIPVRVHAWRFEEGRGTLSLPDEGVCPLHLAGARWTEGRSGGGLFLEGVNSHILLTPADWQALTATNSFTLAVWVRAMNFQRPPPVFSRQTQARKGWAMTVTPAGNVLLEVRGGGEKLRLLSKDVLSPETWHHLAMTLDSSSGKTRAEIHVDGLLSASGEAPWLPEENALPLLIGAYRWSASYDLHFPGRLDNVVISAPAIPDSEIKKLAK